MLSPGFQVCGAFGGGELGLGAFATGAEMPAPLELLGEPTFAHAGAGCGGAFFMPGD